MKHIQHGFTLVELLFVVIIAGIVLAFALPGYKNMKATASEKAATGYLMDLANARDALVRDLNAQGIEEPWKSDTDPWKDLHCNVEVNPTNINPNSADGKTLADYFVEQELGGYGYSETTISHALFAFNYLKNKIGAPGGYRYFLYLGFPILSKCGTLPPDKESKMLAYMCQPPTPQERIHDRGVQKDPLDSRCYIPHAWAYLSDGSILPRDGGTPSVQDPNVCEEKCDMSVDADKKNPSCYDFRREKGYAHDKYGNERYKLAHFSCQRIGGDRAFRVKGPVATYTYTMQVPILGWEGMMHPGEITIWPADSPLPNIPPTDIAWSSDGYEGGGTVIVETSQDLGPVGQEGVQISNLSDCHSVGNVWVFLNNRKTEIGPVTSCAFYGNLPHGVKIIGKKENRTWDPPSCSALFNCIIGDASGNKDCSQVDNKGVVDKQIHPYFEEEAFNGVTIDAATKRELERIGSSGCTDADPGHNHYCYVWCRNLDVTEYNNNKSDTIDGPNNEIRWTDGTTTQSCYNYWHYGASFVGSEDQAAQAEACHADL